jgi:hypothetical protein
MTRFLNFDLLRADEAPDTFWHAVGRDQPQRPRLIAAWRIAPDGRPVRRWRTDDGTEPEG